jgi:hypothetical protein
MFYFQYLYTAVVAALILSYSFIIFANSRSASTDWLFPYFGSIILLLCMFRSLIILESEYYECYVIEFLIFKSIELCFIKYISNMQKIF